MEATTAPAAANLGSATWVAPCGRVAAFESASRCFGVVDALGRMFSTDGERPSVWSTKSIAAQIAEATEFLAGGTWIERA